MTHHPTAAARNLRLRWAQVTADGLVEHAAELHGCRVLVAHLLAHGGPIPPGIGRRLVDLESVTQALAEFLHEDQQALHEMGLGRHADAILREADRVLRRRCRRAGRVRVPTVDGLVRRAMDASGEGRG